jgi:hypothetical protein
MAMAEKRGARITVEWGYERHTIVLTARNWSKVKRSHRFRIRGKGYYYEGEFFWDYWGFAGGSDGDLVVEYGNDGGTGFVGKLREATIEELAL